MDFLSFDSHEWDELALTSLKVLLESVAPNGAVPASVNTRFNVYDHVYPRDASRIAMALDAFGYYEEAERILMFLLSVQRKDGFWAQCYTREGKRSAKAFYGLLELDNQGLVVGALHEHYFATQNKGWLKQIFSSVERAIDFALKYFDTKQDLVWTVASIHEFPPREAGFDLWVNAALCDGLKKGAYLAQELGYQAKANQWMRFSERIRRAFKNFWSETDGFYRKNIGEGRFQISEFWRVWRETRNFSSNLRQQLAVFCHYLNATTYLSLKSRHLPDPLFRLDISAMAPVYFQLLPLDHPQVIKTVTAIETHLSDPKLGGICRYLEGVAPSPGAGFPFLLFGHGPWSFYTAWLAQYFLRRGDLAKGMHYLIWLREKSMKDGKMCEHLDRYTGRLYATDFLWGHAEFLIAIWEILVRTVHPQEKIWLEERIRNLKKRS